jgi:hypothetical protein
MSPMGLGGAREDQGSAKAADQSMPPPPGCLGGAIARHGQKRLNIVAITPKDGWKPSDFADFSEGP